MLEMNVGIRFRSGTFCRTAGLVAVFPLPSTYVEIDRIETRTTVAQGAHHPDHLRLCQRTTCCATERAVYHDAARSAEQEKPRLLRGRKFEMQNQILNLKPPGLVWVPAQNGSHFVQSVQFEVRQSTGHFSSLHVSTCSSETRRKSKMEAHAISNTLQNLQSNQESRNFGAKIRCF